jgi:hypothetical protein
MVYKNIDKVFSLKNYFEIKFVSLSNFFYIYIESVN